MAYRLAILNRDAMLDVLSPNLDGGYVEIRTGTRPATPETAATGTLLATLTFGTPAFGASSSGTIAANAITQDSSADNTGIAGYFRLYTSGAVAVADGVVTAVGGGGELELSNTTITVGYPVEIASLTISLSNP